LLYFDLKRNINRFNCKYIYFIAENIIKYLLFLKEFKMYENEESDVIELREIFQIVRKHILIIILCPIIFALIGGAISFYLINPVYEASTTLIVRQQRDENEEISKTDVDLSKSLIYTYAEMAVSNTVIENTMDALNMEDLKADSITVSPVKDTQILKVAVQNSNPELAVKIADTLVEQFTLEIARITKTDNVAVVDYARLPKEPVKPNKIMNIAISAVLGEMAVLLVVFLKEYLDNTIKMEKDIETYLGVPLIGTIPNFNQGSMQEYGKVHSKRQSRLADSRSV
jgi:capsular polysaccharide biosynthesis protein